MSIHSIRLVSISIDQFWVVPQMFKSPTSEHLNSVRTFRIAIGKPSFYIDHTTISMSRNRSI